MKRHLARRASVSLGIDTFPEEIRDILSEMDDEGNGKYLCPGMNVRDPARVRTKT